MPDTKNYGSDLPQRDAGGRRRGSRPLITSHSFAGARIANDKRETAVNDRGESLPHRRANGKARDEV